MNLRWYQTYDENGLDSEMVLQHYNTELEMWEDVPFVREKEKEE